MIVEKPSNIVLSNEIKDIIVRIKNSYPNLASAPDEYIYEFLMMFDQNKERIDKCRQNIAEQLIYQKEAERLEKIKKKEAEEKHKEELKKKEAEKKHKEELKKKEAEENFRKQEKANQIIEKKNQFGMNVDSIRKFANTHDDFQKKIQENAIDNAKVLDSGQIFGAPLVLGQLAEKTNNEINKKNVPSQSPNLLNFNDQQKKIKYESARSFTNGVKISESQSNHYMKFIPEEKIYGLSNSEKPNSLNDEFNKSVRNNMFDIYEDPQQISSVDHNKKLEKNEYKNPDPAQKKMVKKNKEKPIEEEEKKIPLIAKNLKKPCNTHIKNHNEQEPYINIPPPNQIKYPISSSIKKNNINSIEKQMENHKKKHDEKLMLIKNKHPFKNLQPKIPFEFRHTKNPHLFYNPKESIPSLYYQDELTYEQLLELDRQNYDEGNGYPFEVIAMLNQIQYTKKCEEKETCSICMDEFEKGNIISYLNCGHNFHYNCLANWLSRKKKCPVGCNSDLDEFFNQV
ncbi:hypothetical protein SteCoe_13502 [Stentor coeruleus]|uniref:RING-type domain-containing protein n=1 Tax=Stentor coeruleus TaxID=5963 RepID=A0A1R2C8B8_9CILI|nr:hypothetical protein SteCoe_13502 [Stentor coeruleus]